MKREASIRYRKEIKSKTELTERVKSFLTPAEWKKHKNIILTTKDEWCEVIEFLLLMGFDIDIIIARALDAFNDFASNNNFALKESIKIIMNAQKVLMYKFL